MKEITDENYEEIIENAHTLIIKFEADWCAPCKIVSPILEELSNENPNVKFAKCNVDENPQVSTALSIRNIPTILFFKNGQVIDKVVGAYPKTIFQKKINLL